MSIKIYKESYTWQKRLKAFLKRVYPMLGIWILLFPEHLPKFGVPKEVIAGIVAGLILVQASWKASETDKSTL